MFHAVKHEVSNNQASRVVTLADVEWLVSPASQEIPLSFADCLQHTPDARDKPQLHEAQSSAAALQDCKQIQCNASVEDSADDFSTFDEEVKIFEKHEEGTKARCVSSCISGLFHSFSIFQFECRRQKAEFKKCMH